MTKTNAELISDLLAPDDHVRATAIENLRRRNVDTPEVISALKITLHDSKAKIRYVGARCLGSLGEISSEVVVVLTEALSKAEDEAVRRDAASLLGQIGSIDEVTIEGLLHGLLDDYNEVRTACIQALVRLGKRFPTAVQRIEKKLVQAIVDPEFDKTDGSKDKRSGHEYAYDGLWLLVVNGNAEGE